MYVPAQKRQSITELLGTVLVVLHLRLSGHMHSATQSLKLLLRPLLHTLQQLSHHTLRCTAQNITCAQLLSRCPRAALDSVSAACRSPRLASMHMCAALHTNTTSAPPAAACNAPAI